MPLGTWVAVQLSSNPHHHRRHRCCLHCCHCCCRCGLRRHHHLPHFHAMSRTALSALRIRSRLAIVIFPWALTVKKIVDFRVVTENNLRPVDNECWEESSRYTRTHLVGNKNCWSVRHKWSELISLLDISLGPTWNHDSDIRSKVSTSWW